MDSTARNMLRDIGMTEEDMAKLSAGQQKMLDARKIYSRLKMIVEVMEAKYCFAGLKPGDQYVFDV